MRKENLPQKLCACCGRPFAWRKKWAGTWETVKFCSEKCRRQKQGAVFTPKILNSSTAGHFLTCRLGA
ncbi:MAG: DUF2256 domain-containing protein [Mucilaginibacter polytrichastri]|nr:DUF2256 domain-containing protein [Mucilaginibacter polytrichastri]